MSTFARHTWHALSGPLAAHRTGSGPRLVFAHGFTQTGQSWRLIAERMAERGYECVVVDLPGHGDSASVRADLRRAADLLITAGEAATYIGYSMGGRVALHAAVMYPHLVRKLVLIGAHPGIEDDDERMARRQADDALAARLHDIGVAAFVDEWVRQPLFAGLSLGEAELADRLHNNVEGLSSSLRRAGAGTQLPLWSRLRELTMPILVIAGANDTKFVDVGRQIVAAVPNGDLAIVPYCGHSVVTQSPDEVRALIEQFAAE
jgi:2-succinyl-6-hydroxy-2,4-cyclohexadiene-1-carboxylate synthase